MLIAIASAVALLGVAEAASAKVMVTHVEACGRAECNARSGQSITAYELLNPTIETGRDGVPQPPPSPSYSIRILLDTHGAGKSRIIAAYHPDDGLLHVMGRRGATSKRFPLRVPRRWVALTSEEVAFYDALVKGLRPDPANPAQMAVAAFTASVGTFLLPIS